MMDNAQLVNIKWTNSNKKYFINKGYQYTKNGDTFYVRVEDLSVGSKKEIIYYCDFCNKEIHTSYNNYLKHKGQYDWCRSCKALYQHSHAKSYFAKKHFDAIRQICNDNNYELITKESEYLNTKMKVVFICPKHGEQEMMLDNMLRGHLCKDCSYEQRGKDKQIASNQLMDEMPTLLNPEEYKNTNTKNLLFRCENCGNKYYTSRTSYLSGRNRCDSCMPRLSSGELIVKSILDKYNINYLMEYSFENCRDKLPLPFDFYLPDYNYCIEFDGQHHFEATYGEEKFDIIKLHDKQKDDYCLRYGVRLLRIPYWYGNDIGNIIKIFLGLT